MTEKIKEIAERIKGLREMSDISVGFMSSALGVSDAEYEKAESGNADLSFTFLHKTAKALGVDITELIRGDAPTLAAYTVERAGEGLPINRRKGFTYLHKASNFKRRVAEPFVVSVPFEREIEACDIAMSAHNGQEFDFVIDGRLKIVVDGHEEILSAGDSIYYDSGRPHGMVATGGEGVKFLAIVF